MWKFYFMYYKVWFINIVTMSAHKFQQTIQICPSLEIIIVFLDMIMTKSQSASEGTDNGGFLVISNYSQLLMNDSQVSLVPYLWDEGNIPTQKWNYQFRSLNYFRRQSSKWSPIYLNLQSSFSLEKLWQIAKDQDC